ncbi:TPA: hypothetical protein ACMD15_003419 [Vibrio cholerae]
MSNKWDALGKVGSDAPLKETTDNKTKPKHLKAVPATYFKKHEELKTNGRTSLDFTSYIIEALREKLERDGAL